MKPIFILVFTLFFVTGSIAQNLDNNIVLYSITEANGLSDDHVQCILKDKDGLLWIGTADGLDEMDGSSITVFRHHDNDSTSIINNNVLSLCEDGKGNIWAGTATGLSYFDKRQKQFISSTPAASPYGSAFFINCVVIDRQQRVWCSTDGGLFLFDVVHRLFRPFYNINANEKNNSSYNRLTHVILDRDEDKLWLATGNGIWSLDLKSFSYKQEISEKNDPVYKELFTYVYESNDKKIWVGNWGNGLEQFDPLSGVVVHYTALASHPDVVKCITEVQQPDGKNVLWLDGKFLAFDPLNNRFFNYSIASQNTETPSVLPCYRSADGWIWLASSQGLYVYNPNRQFFQHHFFPKAITSQGVVFAEWDRSLLTGGQSENFLKLYDNNWNLKRNFGNVFVNNGKKMPGAALLSLTLQQNTFWAGTDEGIAKIDISTNKVQWFQHKANDSTSPPRNFITDVFFDSKKTLWFFPWREGIWTMDIATGKCSQLYKGFINANGNEKKLLISSAAEDKNGNIWMTDLDEGIILFERSTGRFSKPFVKELGDLVYSSAIFYRDGFLYSATSNSLLKWNENQRQLKIIDLPEEMRKTIYDIRPDTKSNWWIATKNGLVAYNEDSGSFRRFTTADGLLNNDMDGSLFCRGNGEMIFGSPGYVTTFNPEKFLSAVANVPRQQIKQIFANQKPVMWNGSGTLHFDYRSKNILITWALPDFSSPLHNQYYCRLEGIDTNWRYVGNTGEVQYANLSAGKYIVELRAASANGVIAPNIITIPFEIEPPFWQTARFIALVGIAVIIIFGIIIRYISQRNLKERLLLLEKEQAIEKERNRISRDMHDDLGSGLTKIAIMSEVIKKQIHEPEKAKQQLENISQSSRELVDNLQDIIWVLNPKNDTLESLAAYIREYALKFFEPFETNIEFNYPEKFPVVKLSEETRRNIFLVMKESFNNIARHAWCNIVKVSIEDSSRHLKIKICDDGKGFAPDEVRLFGNGLINMKNRIEQISGKYEVVSKKGEGTITSIVIEV